MRSSIVFKCEMNFNFLIISDTSINIYEHEQVNPKAKIQTTTTMWSAYHFFGCSPVKERGADSAVWLCRITVRSFTPKWVSFHESAKSSEPKDVPISPENSLGRCHAIHKVGPSTANRTAPGSVAWWHQRLVFSLLCVTSREFFMFA